MAEVNGFIEPVLQYGRQDGLSVIGGFVYRGSSIPELQGKYVFADWLSELFYGDLETGEVFRFQPDIDGARLLGRALSVGQDADGELYLLGDKRGTVLKLIATSIPGDSNGDGLVDIVDLNSARNHFGAMGPDDGTTPGDVYPFDGVVNVVDLNRVRNNFGARINVPEPTTLLLTVLGGMVVCSVDSRKRRRGRDARVSRSLH